MSASITASAVPGRNGKNRSSRSSLVGPVEQIASKLIIGTEGQAKGTLTLSEGAVQVEARINSVELATNEMDGGWLLVIGFANGETIFDAITEKSGVGAKLKIGGVEFDLARISASLQNDDRRGREGDGRL